MICHGCIPNDSTQPEITGAITRNEEHKPKASYSQIFERSALFTQRTHALTSGSLLICSDDVSVTTQFSLSQYFISIALRSIALHCNQRASGSHCT